MDLLVLWGYERNGLMDLRVSWQYLLKYDLQKACAR